MKGRRAPGPERLEHELGRELARLGGAPGGADLAAIVAAWPAAVGADVARNAWPARLARDGALVVHVASSAWAFELTQLEARVRERLAEVAPERLRFVVGPVPEPAAPGSVPEACRSLPRPGADDLRRGARIAAAIEDPALRELAARAVSAALARSAAPSGTTDPSDTIEGT